MNLKFLTVADMATLFKAAIVRLNANGADFYGWKNSPEFDGQKFSQVQGWGDSAQPVEITPDAALSIYKSKLDGAYGERFLNTLGMISALVSNNKQVAILQKNENGLPFDAADWIILCIEGYPMFHVSPDDLAMADIASIVNLVQEGTEEYTWTEWKGTDKVSEYTMLLNWLAE
jgi:hypothetical protein